MSKPSKRAGAPVIYIEVTDAMSRAGSRVLEGSEALGITSEAVARLVFRAMLRSHRSPSRQKVRLRVSRERGDRFG